jgi:hypothetical protein
VRDIAAELERAGELARRIEETAALLIWDGSEG